MSDKYGTIEILMDGKAIPIRVKVVESAGFVNYILPLGSVPYSISYPIGKSPIRLKDEAGA